MLAAVFLRAGRVEDAKAASRDIGFLESHLAYFLYHFRRSHLEPPSGQYENLTNVVLQNRTDHELATISNQVIDKINHLLKLWSEA